MEIKCVRHWFTEKTTSGIIRVDGKYFCFSLEDTARPVGVKIPGVTCISPGIYDLTVNQSTRFKRLMPLLNGVPMFSGVRFHWGNKDTDTEGCPIVGYGRDPKNYPDQVLNSRKAFEDLFKLVQDALGRGEKVTWEVINEPL